MKIRIWNDVDKKKMKCPEKKPYQCHFTTNLIWADLGSNRTFAVRGRRITE